MEIHATDDYTRWFRKLKDQTAKARILIRIRRISLGNFGDIKLITNKISEIRIDYGPGYRLYYTQRNNEVILLLIGGNKSSQIRDIDKAKKILAVLEEREK